MVGLLRCGGFWLPDHALSCLLLTRESELVWLQLPVRRLQQVRAGRDFSVVSEETELRDLLELGLPMADHPTTPHQRWREGASWGLPGAGDPGPGVLGAWYGLLRRQSWSRGQGDLKPRAFLDEIQRRIDQGVDWVIDGLPPLHAELVRTRSIGLPLVQRLLDQAKEHPNPDAVRFAEQALRTLPLGLLDVLVDHEPAWCETLLAGGSLGRLLSQAGITPAVYRLMLRDSKSRRSGLADGLVDEANWRLACRALTLIAPSDWPRTDRDQRLFAQLVNRLEWEREHDLAHRFIAWAWAPRLVSALRCLAFTRSAAFDLVCMEEPKAEDDRQMAKFIQAILDTIPPISRVRRAQRRNWVRTLQEKLCSRRLQRQLWHAVNGPDAVPTAERMLELTQSLPTLIEWLGMGWLRVMRTQQEIQELGAEVGNCLKDGPTMLHYLKTGNLIWRAENQTGGLLGVLATRVRRAVDEGMPSDERMVEWQAVGEKTVEEGSDEMRQLGVVRALVSAATKSGAACAIAKADST